MATPQLLYIRQAFPALSSRQWLALLQDAAGDLSLGEEDAY
jgi:hypothetical protein